MVHTYCTNDRTLLPSKSKSASFEYNRYKLFHMNCLLKENETNYILYKLDFFYMILRMTWEWVEGRHIYIYNIKT